LGLIYKVKVHPEGNPNFFDIHNTVAMRAFWCIIVVLVHVPAMYQNKVQDAVGSFGYIAVSFFFMTSAFGLAKGLQQKPNGIRSFWRRRLPKLLIPQILCNVFFALLFLILFHRAITLESILDIHEWIKWLLCCYFLFWLTKLIFKNEKARQIVPCLCIAGMSLLLYFLHRKAIITSTIWPTEIYGFVWGLLLAANYDRFQISGSRKWLRNVIVSCTASLLLGVLYLKFKPVAFFGDYCLKIVLGLAIVVFILILNSRISIGNKIISFLGNISFEIYLVHGAVFDLLSGLLGEISSGLFLFLSILVIIGIACILHLLSQIIIKRLFALRWFRG